MLSKYSSKFRDANIEEQAIMVKRVTLPYWSKIKEHLPNTFGENWYNYATLRQGAPLLVECFNAFIRLWIEYRKKKSKIHLIKDIKDSSLYEYATSTVLDFIEQTDPSLPWKYEKYWSVSNGAFKVKYKAEGDMETCKYIFGCLRPANMGSDNWSSFIRNPQRQAARLRYNKRRRKTY